MYCVYISVCIYMYMRVYTCLYRCVDMCMRLDVSLRHYSSGDVHLVLETESPL